MTLRDLFDQANTNPAYLYYYFLGIPALCFLLLLIFRNPNNALKVNWLLTCLCFMTVIPGIFALTYNIYTFLFERQSILEMNLLIQVLPIISMLVSLYLIKRILPFDYIPGFEKLTSMAALIFGIMAIMWIVDKTHIMAFAYLPFSYIIIALVAIILAIKFLLPRLF
jgi:hypothetical protein